MSTALVFAGTYTTDSNEGIYCLRLSLASGALEVVGATKPVPDPFFLAVDAERNLLFAANALSETDGEPGGAVSAFAVDPDSGALTFLNRQPSRGVLPCYLTMDRTGRNLLVANYTSGSVAVLPIRQDGRLGEATAAIQHEGSGPDPERQEGPHVHSIVLDPMQRHAFAADLGADRVVTYRFDAAAGALTPGGPPFVEVHAGAGPRHLAFHPNRRYAYLLNELDNTFTVFAFDADRGALTPIQTLPSLPSDSTDTSFAADLQILPSGDFLYGSNRGHDSIAICAIDQATGRLTSVGHQPSGGAWPWNLAIDPTASLLLAANQKSDSITVFRIDPDTGGLSPTGHEVSVPRPVNLAFLQR